MIVNSQHPSDKNYFNLSSGPEVAECGSEPRPLPQNPFLRFRVILDRLGIPDKLDSIPLSPLTSEEKSQLKEIFDYEIRHENLHIDTTFGDIERHLIRSAGLKSVYQCGSGPLKKIARTLFPRWFGDIYRHVNGTELEFHDELNEAFEHFFKVFCVETDYDIRNHFSGSMGSATAAHFAMVNFFGDDYDKVTHGGIFKNLILPIPGDGSVFGLATIGIIDIVNVEILKRTSIYTTGDIGFNATPILLGQTDKEIAAEGLNPAGAFLDILQGKMWHGEAAKSTPHYEGSDFLKLAYKLVKGLTNENPEIVNDLIDACLHDKKLQQRWMRKTWDDHLPKNRSSAAALIFQTLLLLLGNSKFNNVALSKFVEENRDLWSGTRLDALLDLIAHNKDNAILFSIALLNVLAWAEGGDIINGDHIQFSVGGDLLSTICLPYNFEESLKILAANPKLLEKVQHLLPKPGNLRPCLELLESEHAIVKKLGLILSLNSKGALHPLVYQNLPSIPLTNDEISTLQELMPIDLKTRGDPLVYARELMKLNQEELGPVISRYLKNALDQDLSIKERASLLKTLKATSHFPVALKTIATDWLMTTEEHEHALHFSGFLCQLLLEAGGPLLAFYIWAKQEEHGGWEGKDKSLLDPMFTQLASKGKEHAAKILFNTRILTSDSPVKRKLSWFDQLLQKFPRLSSEERQKYARILIGQLKKRSDTKTFVNTTLKYSPPEEAFTAIEHLIEQQSPLSHDDMEKLAGYCWDHIDRIKKVFELWQKGHEYQLWDQLKSRENYEPMVGRIYQYVYPQVPKKGKVLNDLMMELGPSIRSARMRSYREEIAALQVETLRNDPHIVESGNFEPIHVFCLSADQALEFQLGHFKILLDAGKLDEALKFALKLSKKNSKEYFIDKLEKAILKDPSQRYKVCLTSHYRRFYKRYPNRHLSFLLTILEHPKILEEILTLCDRNQKLITSSLLRSLQSYFCHHQLTPKGKKLVTKLFPKFVAALADQTDRVDLLDGLRPHVCFKTTGQGPCDAALTILISDRLLSPLKSIRIFMAIERSKVPVDPQLRHKFLMAHPEIMQWEDRSQTLEMLKRNREHTENFLSAHPASFSAYVDSASPDNTENWSEFLHSCLDLAKGSESLLDKIAASFIEKYRPHHSKQELILLNQLYRLKPNEIRLDQIFTSLILHISTETNPLSKKEKNIVVSLLTMMANKNRGIFSLARDRSPLREIVPYLTGALEWCKENQKLLMMRKFAGLDSIDLTPQGCATLVDHLLSSRSLTTDSLYAMTMQIEEHIKEYKSASPSIRYKIYLSTAQLNLRLNQFTTLTTCLDHLLSSYQLLVESQKKKDKSLKRANFHEVLAKMLDSPLLHVEKHQSSNFVRIGFLVRIAQNIKAKDISSESILLLLSLLQIYCHELTLTAQLQLCEQYVARYPISGRCKVDPRLKTLLSKPIQLFSEPMDPLSHNEEAKETICRIAKHPTIVHYLSDYATTEKFLSNLILMKDKDILDQIHPLLKAYFGHDTPPARQDINHAVIFTRAQLNNDDNEMQFWVKTYVERLVNGSISKHACILHLTIHPHVTRILLKHSQHEQYRAFIKHVLQEGTRITTERLFQYVRSLVYDDNVTEFFAFKGNFDAICHLMQMTLRGVRALKFHHSEDYEFLIDLAILTISTGDETLISEFSLSQYCFLYLQNQLENQNQSHIFSQLIILKSFFEDHDTERVVSSDEDHIEVIRKFAGVANAHSLAITIAMFYSLFQPLKESKPDRYRNFCQTIHTAFSEGQKSYIRKKELETIPLFMTAVKSYLVNFVNASFPDLMDTLSDLIRYRKSRCDHLVDLYGELISFIVSETWKPASLCEHLSLYLSFKAVNPDTDFILRLHHLVHSVIRNAERMDEETAALVFSFLEYLLKSPIPHARLRSLFIILFDELFKKENDEYDDLFTFIDEIMCLMTQVKVCSGFNLPIASDKHLRSPISAIIALITDEEYLQDKEPRFYTSLHDCYARCVIYILDTPFLSDEEKNQMISSLSDAKKKHI